MSLSEYGNSAVTEVIVVARSLNDVQIKRILEALVSGELSLTAGVLEVQHILSLSVSESRSVATLLRRWESEGGSSETLAIALLTARTAHLRTLADAQSVQLVWTGPISTPGATRSTMSALLDLVDKAHQEIIIVGYALTEAASIVLEHLAAAQRRGVQVILIGDRMEEKLSLIKAYWPAGQRLPLLYTRAERPDDPKSALHAKLSIADQRYMLVTSANLTYHGLTGNIEIGVEIEGKTAAEAVILLNRLITEGICTRIEDSI